MIHKMEKKPNGDTKATEEMLKEVSEDVLLYEDLDDDLLLQEAEAFFGPVSPKKTRKPTVKPTVKPLIKPKKVTPPIEKPPMDLQKPVISKTTMKELQQFMVSKAKIYEEMAFHTILRKISPKWHFTEPVLIDVLEALIEKEVFKKEKLTLKMTASSVKFYPNS